MGSQQFVVLVCVQPESVFGVHCLFRFFTRLVVILLLIFGTAGEAI